MVYNWRPLHGQYQFICIEHLSLSYSVNESFSNVISEDGACFPHGNDHLIIRKASDYPIVQPEITLLLDGLNCNDNLCETAWGACMRNYYII